MRKLTLVLLSVIIFNVCPIFAEENLYLKYEEVIELHNGEKGYICRNYSHSKDVPDTFLIADKDGNPIFGPQLGIITETDSDDRFIYSDEYNKYSLLDGKGNVITNFSEKYKNIQYIEKINGLDAYSISIIKDNEHKQGIVDINGNVLLPIKYDFTIDNIFQNGFLQIMYTPTGNINNKKYGFINEEYTIVAPPEYDDWLICGDIIYLYKNDGKNINYYKIESNAPVFYKTLNLYACSMYEREKINSNYITLYKETNEKSDTTKNYYGFADKNLNIIVEPKYDSPILFDSKGYSIIQYGSTEWKDTKAIGRTLNGKYGIIDKNGNEVTAPEYDYIVSKENGRFALFKNNEKELRDFSGEIKSIECSDWAKEIITYGEWSELIPEEINSDFKKDITREEFCKLAVQTFLKYKGDWSIDDYTSEILKNVDFSKHCFNDTNDKIIIFANILGIVNGKSDGNFAPNDTITRQEAAVMIVNMLKAGGHELSYNKNKSFSDENLLDNWAKDAVYKITSFKGDSGIPVMTGIGGNKFSPLNNYSREQAIATMVRIYDIYNLNF